MRSHIRDQSLKVYAFKFLPQLSPLTQRQTTWGREPVGDQLQPFDPGVITGFLPTIVVVFDRAFARVGDPTREALQSSREDARRDNEPGRR